MPDTSTNKKLIEAMSIIAEPTRLRILQVIASRGQMCAKEILPEFNITQPTLSHHMNLLEECGLVATRKEGRMVYYSINKPTIAALSELILSLNDKTAVSEVIKAEEPKTRKPAVKKETPAAEPKPEVKPDSKKDKDKKKKKDKDKGEKKKKDKKKKNK